MSDLLTLACFSFKISAINELFKAFPMNSSFEISPSLSSSIVDLKKTKINNFWIQHQNAQTMTGVLSVDNYY